MTAGVEMHARRRLSTSVLGAGVSALVAISAALAAQTPAAAAAHGSSDLPRWALAAADGASRTAAVRESLIAWTEARTTGISTFRIAGPNRYATSVAATQALYTDDVIAEFPLGVVFVASGTNFPDALASSALATPFGPLLLVPPTGTVPSVVINELSRLAPDFIVLVGGTGAVSEGVRSQLATLAETDRIAGADRYATAALIAEITNGAYESEEPGVSPGAETVYVAAGENFPDALAGGAATGVRRGAIVLTRSTSLPAASADAIEEIAPPRVVVLGSAGVVSEAVVAQLEALVPGGVTRLAGPNRFATAAAVAAGEFTTPPAIPGVLLANGLTFPDALSASGFGAVVQYPLLLSRPTCAPAATVARADAYEQELTDPLEVVGFGGTSVLSSAALSLTPC